MSHTLRNVCKHESKNNNLTRSIVIRERRQLIEKKSFYWKEKNENWHVMKLFVYHHNVSCLIVNSYRKKEISAYTFVWNKLCSSSIMPNILAKEC